MQPIYKEIISFAEKHDDIFRKPVKEHKLVAQFVKEYDLSVLETNTFFLFFKEIMKAESSISPQSIREKFAYSFEEYIELLSTVDNLKKKGMLISDKADSMLGTTLNPNILIDDILFQRLVFGKHALDNCKLDDIYSVIEYASEIIDKRDNKELTTKKLYTEINTLLKKASKYINELIYIMRYNNEEKIALLIVIDEYLNGNNVFLTAKNISSTIMDNKSEQMYFYTKIINEDLQIIKDGFVSIDSNTFITDSDNIKLTQKGARKILNLKKKKTKKINFELSQYIKHSTLKSKLFFEKQFQEEILRLQKVLEPTKFKQLLKELEKNNHSKGFVSLFYGLAGTGKTASVYEIAHKTKRDVLQVNIEKIRDKYVGESEKKLAQIFEEYKEAKKVLKRVPILLFNEADALLGQRIGISNSVDQMNNSMQNILLQNLENFKGIFIATTNLIENIDDAFSRRFLYKLEFPKPTRETRIKIWKTKLPNLPKKIYTDISKYELTGAQIEVIAKQFFIRSFLEDTTDENILHNMIKNELSYKTEKTNSMGFLNS